MEVEVQVKFLVNPKDKHFLLPDNTKCSNKTWNEN
jgi:hypothetical protein